MAELFFSLRFHSQLKRTRYELASELEKEVADALKSFGGRVAWEHKRLRAVFDDGALGFALDLYCIVEKLREAAGKVASELYGYSCAIAPTISEEDAALLSQALPSDLWGSGIWCSPEIKNLLAPLLQFDAPLAAPDYPPPLAGFSQVRSNQSPSPSSDEGESASGGDGMENPEKICQYLMQGAQRNTTVAGPEFAGKREGLYRYCRVVLGNFPPAIIRFGEGNAAALFADVLSPALETILPSWEKLVRRAQPLFAERLRDELSPFTLKKCAEFFRAFLEDYMAAAEKARVHPVLLLENIHAARAAERETVSAVAGSLPSRDKLYLYGTCSDMRGMKPWEEIFPRIIKFTPEKKNRPALPEMPAALWEVAYAACLLGRFFPPFLVPALLAEEGKNPAMVERSLAFLAEKSVVESLSYPAPVLPEIAKAAEAKLNQNSIDKIRALVRSRLLAWTAAGKLKPCCRLLEALAALGEKGGSALALEAVRSDVANGTFSRFEKMLAENALPEIAGAENAAPLASVFRARKALAWGTAEELRAAGAEAPPGPLPPSFAPEAFASETAFSLSACDTESASTQVKEAMLAAQNENAPLARAYRLFSLLNVETKRFSDAIDYFGFAVEDAEKRGDLAELALAKFYAAQAHFLFGNLSRASRFALEAEETASLAGLAAWADRARFFRGRLCFEAGRYQEALDVFALLETAPHHSDSSELPPEAAPLFRETLGAWTYRCRAYLGETLRRSGQGGFDRRLFEIEAAYLSGDWKSAAELARDEGAPDGDRFLLLEQPDWRSGFAQCELLAFPLRDMRRRMFLAWRTLALCRFSAGAERDESIREMRRAMRDEISDADPADSFYGYAWYRILKSSGAPEVDQSTAISAAFKKMQIRAGRIDDNETKRAYLSLHRWNSALETAAREHKLL